MEVDTEGVTSLDKEYPVVKAEHEIELRSSNAPSQEIDLEVGDLGKEEKTQDAPNSIQAKRTKSILSRTSSYKTQGPPPDGGLKAWTQVLMSHLVSSSCWGFITSWGAFQTYYSQHLLSTTTQSTISWIGSCQTTLIFLVGIGSGRAMDAGYFHHLIVTGSILQLVGVMTMSVSTTFWQLLLSQGICFGVGAGLVFTPTMALLSTYFTKKRNLAMGISACGSCTGGLVFPSVVRELVPQIGFPWTVRILGFIMLAFNTLAIAFLKPRIAPRISGPLVEWAAFKEPTYAFMVGGMFFVFWALYFAFYYIGLFSRNVIGLSYFDSINLLLVMVGVGMTGRLVPAVIADRYTGPLNAMIPFVVTCGTMFFAWTGISQTASLYVFATIYGIGSAGIQSLFPASLASLTCDLQKAGTRLGMGFFVISFAVLTGPPLAGALITRANGEYVHAQIWAGCSMFLGVGLLVAARVAKTGWLLRASV